MNTLTQLNTALAGRYDVERQIGAGGMATVYLARDVRHDRRVALKLLSPELGAVLGVERFLSEIRVTANLQHPNLLPLFDSGEAGGLLFYVMPFIEGETLRQRIEREKLLPIDDAVRITVAIANALDYAHRHGVIHRDLKPENILLHDGQPLVADFGIALAVSNAGGARITQTGLSLGTPQYMSPEQAAGDRTVDGRTDIYALGAVSYEMLAGEPPHSGTTAQAIIARLMTEEPRPLSAVRHTIPPHVEAAIHHALEKLPADRFATAREFAEAIQGRGPRLVTAGGPVTARRRPAIANAAPWIVVAAVSVAAVAGWWKAAQIRPSPSVRFSIDAPQGEPLADAPGVPIALSRDGRLLAFLAGPGPRLYVRPLDHLEATAFTNVPVAYDPRFSPDGKWIAYKTPDRVGKISVDGAASEPLSVASVVSWTGIAWEYSPDVFYMAGNTLWRVPDRGVPRKVAVNADTSRAELWSNPSLLPDGRTVAVRVITAGSRPGTAADRLGFISIENGKLTVTGVEGQNVLGYIDGLLVFTRINGRILAARFDLATRRLLGEPLELTADALWKPAGGIAASLAADGTLAYETARMSSVLQVFDEHGKLVLTLPEERIYARPAWSPDGNRIAVQITAAAHEDIWAFDVGSRVLSRVTATGDAQSPVWTPDGKRIAYLDVTGIGHLMWLPADGSGRPTPVPGTAALDSRRTREVAFTPDGKSAVIRVAPQDGAQNGDVQLFLVALSGERRRRPKMVARRTSPLLRCQRVVPLRDA